MFAVSHKLSTRVPCVVRTMATHTPSTGSASNEAKAPKTKQPQITMRNNKVLHQYWLKKKAVKPFQELRSVGSTLKRVDEQRELTLERMVAAGMHLGHSVGRWNPMNLPYIFGERQGIHVINLEQTMAALRRAAQFVRQTVYRGGLVLFVGTRREHRAAAVEAALACDQYFVTGKWVPGTLTNKRSVLGHKYKYANDEWDVAEAQEMLNMENDRAKKVREDNAKSNRYLKLIEKEQKDMEPFMPNVNIHGPDLIVSLSPRESGTMLREARVSFVPTVGVIDTNANPRVVTYPIPCNDDSPEAVSIVARVLARAAREGMDLRRHRLLRAVKESEERESEKTETDKFMNMAQDMGEGLDTRSVDDDVDGDHH
ncbi:hypothetical protein GGH12_001391 [Coemansia sp. RSA 1822]|nr:hypothetical protein LPJ76_001435 [Coemansia sp. RSA 638]KAJ2121547.1 hypothetical protein IW147_004167 [Coemansia sp. RSA 720]KAJ2543926.1 hypothetical protein GGF49_001677 [Coemansia sp. RSA 1853]KAJ2565467.1 hypothetical protein GGH12_001391 [Coemansia sp. RSA 1822]